MHARHRQSLVAILGAVLMAGTVAPAQSPISVFGIRLGMDLGKQFEPCTLEALELAARRQACWTKDPYGGRTVLFPAALLIDAAPSLRIRRIREVDGVVVEVEAEMRPNDVGRVSRYLRRQLGAPTESERYERASRVSGIGTHASHSWKADGVTIHFLEVAASDNGSIRGILDSWARRARVD